MSLVAAPPPPCLRFARRLEPASFPRLDALHRKRPNLIATASLIRTFSLSRANVDLLNVHVENHVKQAMLRARWVWKYLHVRRLAFQPRIMSRLFLSGCPPCGCLACSKIAEKCGTGAQAAAAIRAAELPRSVSAASISNALMTATDRQQGLAASYLSRTRHRVESHHL